MAKAFGAEFTPHMITQRYEQGAWKPAEIVPYANFSLAPSSVVFHYGQALFEGFKVYQQPDRSLSLFRPEKNLQRLNNSAARMSMPGIDVDATLAKVKELIRADKDQAPERPGTLYVRPCMIATDEMIRVKPSESYLFFIVLCPVEGYFSGGDARGVRISTSTKYVRAAPGGTGAAKCAGNYAASLAAQKEAEADGFEQVLWLDAKEQRYVEEIGAMNVMFVIDETLVTPSLDVGSILPGVTRDSILTMLRAEGMKVEERKIGVDELLEANKAGRLKEAFGCGTAAVVTPIREIVHVGQELYSTQLDGPGPLATRLKQQLTDLQFGVAEDSYGWRVPVG